MISLDGIPKPLIHELTVPLGIGKPFLFLSFAPNSIRLKGGI